jgi:hypothetical protein
MYNAHIDTLFYGIRVFPYVKIISFNKALFTHAVEYGYNLNSFKNIWQTNNVRNLAQEPRNTDRYIL